MGDLHNHLEAEEKGMRVLTKNIEIWIPCSSPTE